MIDSLFEKSMQVVLVKIQTNKQIFIKKKKIQSMIYENLEYTKWTFSTSWNVLVFSL